MRFQPTHAGNDGGIDAGIIPPSSLIAAAVDLATVAAAQRDGDKATAMASI